MQDSTPAISDKSKTNRQLSSSLQIAERTYRNSAIATPSAIHPSIALFTSSRLCHLNGQAEAFRSHDAQHKNGIVNLALQLGDLSPAAIPSGAVVLIELTR